MDFVANRTEISSGLLRPNFNHEGVKVLDKAMEEIAEVWPTAPPKGTISVFIYCKGKCRAFIVHAAVGNQPLSQISETGWSIVLGSG